MGEEEHVIAAMAGKHRSGRTLRRVRALPSARLLACLLAFAALPACASGFFSYLPSTDRSRPVALVETTGGIELAATTELGILLLGRSATEGPCRVHYFLGKTPMIEDGELQATGTSFLRARIDLKTQLIRVLDRPITDTDELVAMWTPDGVQVRTVPVRIASGDGITGDVLHDPANGDPAQDLPAGAAVLAVTDTGLRFAGLVSARATLQAPGGDRRYYTFAGVDRVRELLAVPEIHPQDYKARYRPDDISVLEPVR